MKPLRGWEFAELQEKLSPAKKRIFYLSYLFTNALTTDFALFNDNSMLCSKEPVISVCPTT